MPKRQTLAADRRLQAISPSQPVAGHTNSPPPSPSTLPLQLSSSSRPRKYPSERICLATRASSIPFTTTVLLQTCGGCSVAFPWLLRSHSLHSTRTSSPRRGGTHTSIIFDATSSTQTADIPLHLPEVPTLRDSLPTTRPQLGACRRRRRQQPVTLLTFCPRAMVSSFNSTEQEHPPFFPFAHLPPANSTFPPPVSAFECWA